MEAQPEARKDHFSGQALNEPWKHALKLLTLNLSGYTLKKKAHSGALETDHSGALGTCPGEVEAHPGDVQAHQGAMQNLFGTI